MSEEIWKDVVGFEGLYMVSNLGAILALKRKVVSPNGHRYARERILRQANSNGYSLVMVCKNGERVNRNVHRMVADAFLLNPENKPCVNHKNGVRNDNRVENLEWCTYSENELHSHRCLGKVPLTGPSHGQYKHGRYCKTTSLVGP